MVVQKVFALRSGPPATMNRRPNGGAYEPRRLRTKALDPSSAMNSFMEISSLNKELREDVRSTMAKQEKAITELKQDIADTKLELKQDIADTKLELKQDIADLKLDLKQDIAAVGSKLDTIAAVTSAILGLVGVYTMLHKSGLI